MLSPDFPHIQILRKAIDSRDQGNEGGTCERDRRDKEGSADERKDSHYNQTSVEFRFHITALISFIGFCREGIVLFPYQWFPLIFLTHVLLQISVSKPTEPG